VVMDVLLHFNLAAISNYLYFLFHLLQPNGLYSFGTFFHIYNNIRPSLFKLP
jgi:hypothetical protein